MSIYICRICTHEWEYAEEDYNGTHEGVCPLCSSSVSWAFKEVFRNEGFVEAVKYIIRRYESPN